jgi:HD superfamily phosphohydrolase
MSRKAEANRQGRLEVVSKEETPLVDTGSRETTYDKQIASVKGEDSPQGQPEVTRVVDALTPKASADEKLTSARADSEFFIPIHGFVWLSDEEKAVVDHPAFQRLGCVHQLGHAHMIYRGATHTRFEHSVGSVHMAQEIIDAVRRNHLRLADKRTEHLRYRPDRSLSDLEVVFTRLAALLHDIGHIPFGHTLEDELQLFKAHDSLDRINLVLDKIQWHGEEVESLRTIIDRHYRKHVHNLSTSPSQILISLIQKTESSDLSESNGPIRIQVCRDIVGNTICADLYDYLHRDWYHIGKVMYFEKRLFQYFELWRDSHRSTNQSHFVVALGEPPKFRSDAISIILQLLESRYHLSESVLYHRTKCAAAACLERGLQEMHDSIGSEDKKKVWVTDLQSSCLEKSDDQIVQELLSDARKKKIQSAVLPFSALKQRRVYKELYSVFLPDIRTGQFELIEELYSAVPSRVSSQDNMENDTRKNRLHALRRLEEDFMLPRGSLAMYCPGKEMGFKIASVKVKTEDVISPLHEWDKKNRGDVTGGHLAAQENRFKRLWRVHFFIDRSEAEKRSPEFLRILRKAVRILLLKLLDQPAEWEDEVLKLALQASKMDGTILSRRPVDSQRMASQLSGGRADLYYPTGMPCLSLFA